MNEVKSHLLHAAKNALQNAYAPYSSFRVGAALLTDTGEVYVGCNVENASYGLTCCAERNAVFSAVADGRQTFTALAIVAEADKPAMPCGACRQVLYEFAPQMAIWSATPMGEEVVETTVAALLPDAFGL